MKWFNQLGKLEMLDKLQKVMMVTAAENSTLQLGEMAVGVREHFSIKELLLAMGQSGLNVIINERLPELHSTFANIAQRNTADSFMSMLVGSYAMGRDLDVQNALGEALGSTLGEGLGVTLSSRESETQSTRPISDPQQQGIQLSNTYSAHAPEYYRAMVQAQGMNTGNTLPGWQEVPDINLSYKMGDLRSDVIRTENQPATGKKATQSAATAKPAAHSANSYVTAATNVGMGINPTHKNFVNLQTLDPAMQLMHDVAGWQVTQAVSVGAQSAPGFMDHVAAFNRGVVGGEKDFGNSLLHAGNTLRNAALFFADNSPMSFFSQGARARNEMRIASMMQGIDAFAQADSVTRTEMIAREITLFVMTAGAGEAVGRAARLGSSTVGRTAGAAATIGKTAESTTSINRALSSASEAAAMGDIRYLEQKFYEPIVLPTKSVDAQTFKGFGMFKPVEKIGTEGFVSTGGRQIKSVEAALNADNDAAKFYEMIRSNSSNEDIHLISKNTGMPMFQIQRIKQHVFFDTHQLSTGVDRFAPDFEIADAWTRLQKGNFVKSDIDLLKHEYFEAKFKGIFKTDYMTAHNAAVDSLRTWNPQEFIATPEMIWRP